MGFGMEGKQNWRAEFRPWNVEWELLGGVPSLPLVLQGMKLEEEWSEEPWGWSNRPQLLHDISSALGFRILIALVDVSGLEDHTKPDAHFGPIILYM